MHDFNRDEAGDKAFYMRKANPEQFYVLVRMHLSFEFDSTTEDIDCIPEKAKLKKWGLLAFAKKPKSTLSLQKEADGAILCEKGIKQVKQLIEYLSRDECLVQEGIFRRTGKLTRQQELKNALYQGIPLNFDECPYNVHDCASVLKGFLADLSEPLMTELHFPTHCKIAEFCGMKSEASDARTLRCLQLLLLLLPQANRVLLRDLVILLNKAASFEDSNKMNCDTLATLFTPHLLCPRKLTPEALHVNSQNLSGLVAFMIKTGEELFNIPQKLSIEIDNFWTLRHKNLLSPQKVDMNESTSDSTGMAQTVFTFIDQKLTAEANATEDTQAELAKLYAYIQAMPESAKKRRLVKQFNKENGNGTPRHVKNNRTKSLGDSIKKHIFQKKILGHKKFIDINIGCNISRSSSDENISKTLETSELPTKTRISKSDEELNCERSDSLVKEDSVRLKSNSTGDLATPPQSSFKNSYTGVNEETHDTSSSSRSSSKSRKELLKKSLSRHSGRLSRHSSEPPNMFSSIESPEPSNELMRQNSEPICCLNSNSHVKVVYTPPKAKLEESERRSKDSSRKSGSLGRGSPVPHIAKIWNHGKAHTSTPSDFLRRNMPECNFTPMTDDEKSMSPITQSTAKMTKAMQETMMTPRSRKPVVMISSSNICNLAPVENTWSGNRCNPSHYGCSSIIEESPKEESSRDDKENLLNETGGDDTRENSSLTQPFRKYLMSRTVRTTVPSSLSTGSIFTSSPVDLSFASRTGDYDQSTESDLNVLYDNRLSDSLLHCLDGNNPSSDTSGIASSSGNSADSAERSPSPRKRATNLHRNDSKRSREKAKQRQINESNSPQSDETVQETSF